MNPPLALISLVGFVFAYLAAIQLLCHHITLRDHKRRQERLQRWREWYDEKPKDSEWWK